MRTFVLVVVIVGVAGIVQMRPSPPQMLVGVVKDVEPGQWIRIGSEQTDPGGFPIALTSRTRIDGRPGDLRRDARVQVIYAYTGGGAVARHIVILQDDAGR